MDPLTIMAWAAGRALRPQGEKAVEWAFAKAFDEPMLRRIQKEYQRLQSYWQHKEGYPPKKLRANKGDVFLWDEQECIFIFCPKCNTKTNQLIGIHDVGRYTGKKYYNAGTRTCIACGETHYVVSEKCDNCNPGYITLHLSKVNNYDRGVPCYCVECGHSNW